MKVTNPRSVAIVPDSLDATDGAATPFGKRWGGDVIQLSPEHLAALQAGGTVAIDVQNEYIVFLRSAQTEENTPGSLPADAIPASKEASP